MTPETFFTALSDRIRLRLLSLMYESEVCVCFLVEAIDSPQPTVSRHLAYLRSSGLVEARRDGKWMHYRLAADLPEGFARLLGEALALLRDERDFRRDRERLERACCSPRVPAVLKRAPRPVRV